ncbi:MAG: transposase [Bacteroidetes bacterium]|nr:transposase [Bacteroidota bacterium]
MKYDPQKHHRKSIRLKGYDYSQAGLYFITICTQNREHYFGEIRNGKMVLSPMGVLADILWYEIPNHTQSVALGDFVVMPNHIHGILIIDKPDGGIDEAFPVRTLPVRTLHARSPPPPQKQPKNQIMSDISPKSKTVSAIVRSYKSAVTFHGNRLGLNNGWQSRFHDHIIRNDAEYQRISDYIISNPENWGKDKFY